MKRLTLAGFRLSERVMALAAADTMASHAGWIEITTYDEDHLMPAPEVEIVTFSGMVSWRDPHDLDPGEAEIQVNWWSPRPGELATRPGVRECERDSE